MKNPQDTLGLGALLKGIFPLVPRIPSILTYVKTALAIGKEDKLSIAKVLEELAVEHADRPCLHFEEMMWTYGQFNEKVNQYAHYFLDQGVQKGDTVVVYLENRPEMLFIIGAMAKIGGVASLINPNQRSKVLLHSIHVDRGKYFVIGEELVEAFEEVRTELKLDEKDTLYWLKDTDETARPEGYKDFTAGTQSSSTDNPASSQDITAGERFANVFTSGTTGLPKASVQKNQKWLKTYYWFGKVNLNMTQEDVMYIPLPFFHTNALIVSWPSALAAGASVVMRRKFSTTNFWKDVKKYRVTAFVYIGEICRYLLNAPEVPEEKNNSVKMMVGNGLRPDIWQEFKERFQVDRIFELYGGADGNVAFTNTLNIDYCVGWSPNDFAIVEYDLEENEPVRDSNGRFKRVKKGDSGLLISAINDKTPFDGYVNKEKTQAKTFSDVFEDGDLWYNTGDLLRDIGFKHAQFVDRLGDTFRWKGENVATMEVEGVINSLDAVSNCCAYGVHIPHTDGRAGMAAMMLEGAEKDFDFKGLTNLLKKELPSYAVPLVLRISSAFEMTATHKIKKFNLKNEGLDSPEQLYVLLPKADTYVPLTPEIREKMEKGEYAF
ncbi:MAG: long-chain-acyl-CoA synthetase [Bacteroidota bacterium]